MPPRKKAEPTQTLKESVVEQVNDAAVERALVDILKEKLQPYYGQQEAKDRVKNPALPHDSLEINEWLNEYAFKWVPAPGNTAPDVHRAAEMANLRSSYIQKGWQFYPSEQFGYGDGDGLPWLPDWEDDDGRVRAQDHWLMYADHELEEAGRQRNRDVWNDARLPAQVEGDRGAVELGRDSKGRATVLTSEQGRVKALDLLREGGAE